MARIMLIGPVGAGKTSLIHFLQGNAAGAAKTQAISFSDAAIDTPGEYSQIPRFYPALLVTAMEASLVVIVQDAAGRTSAVPPGFANMFSRPVIGVITKIDLPDADREKAAAFLSQAGVTTVFLVSVKTGAGMKDFCHYLGERRCKV